MTVYGSGSGPIYVVMSVCDFLYSFWKGRKSCYVISACEAKRLARYETVLYHYTVYPITFKGTVFYCGFGLI